MRKSRERSKTHQSTAVRPLEDADVEAILEEVNLTPTSVEHLKRELNKWVPRAAARSPSAQKAICAIDEILRGATLLQDALEKFPRTELLLPHETLLDALRKTYLSDLQISARSLEHPLLPPGEPTFGDQLAKLIDYYTSLRAEWEAVAKDRDSSRQHDILVVTLAAIYQQQFKRDATATRDGPFGRFVGGVLRRVGQPVGNDGAHDRILKARKRVRSLWPSPIK